MSQFTRNDIMAMIPHDGAMCLLDEVLAWDATMLRCLSHRFSAADSPLRRADGRLGMACGIEVAAQAMALHGRLTAPAGGALVPGYLVSLRDVHLATAFITGSGTLTITATRLMGDVGGASYDFTVTSEAEKMLSGRATVLFGPKP
jgi:predicted hotdog family 3-hydroxylacyl-ACP dehydratase